MQQQSAVGIAPRPGLEAKANAQLRESALKEERRETMKPYRGNAIAVGVLLIACSATAILSAVPLGSTLDGPNYLSKLAVSGNRVVLTALIEFVWAATAAGIAIGLYPVLRKYNRSLALGSVVGRTIEGMLVLVGTLSLLALLTLGQESAVAGAAAASSYQVVGDTLLAVRDWALGFLMSLSFGTAALMYYYLLYRSRLVPRWLSGWGLIGAGLSIGSTVYAGFTQEFGLTTVSMVANIPGLLLQEMVLAVWLIVKGFKASALASAASAGGSGGRS
jgi:Domain of unknown function (DUF4386)